MKSALRTRLWLIALLLGGLAPSLVQAQNITLPVITTVAGNRTDLYNGDNIVATSAELYDPAGVVLDRADNLYISIADLANQRMPKVDVTTSTLSWSAKCPPAVRLLGIYPQKDRLP
jgi:hypothetical protein